MTIKECVINEIETLPEPQQMDVLTFVRFLKVGLADWQTSEQRFSDALARARAIAAERGINEQDIAQEIRAARADQ